MRGTHEKKKTKIRTPAWRRPVCLTSRPQKITNSPKHRRPTDRLIDTVGESAFCTAVVVFFVVVLGVFWFVVAVTALLCDRWPAHYNNRSLTLSGSPTLIFSRPTPHKHTHTLIHTDMVMRSYRFILCLKIDTNIEVDFYTAIASVHPPPRPSKPPFAIKHRLSMCDYFLLLLFGLFLVLLPSL